MYQRIRAWLLRRTHHFYGEESWIDLPVSDDSINIARAQQPSNPFTGDPLIGQRVITFQNDLSTSSLERPQEQGQDS